MLGFATHFPFSHIRQIIQQDRSIDAMMNNEMIDGHFKDEQALLSVSASHTVLSNLSF